MFHVRLDDFSDSNVDTMNVVSFNRQAFLSKLFDPVLPQRRIFQAEGTKTNDTNRIKVVLVRVTNNIKMRLVELIPKLLLRPQVAKNRHVQFTFDASHQMTAVLGAVYGPGESCDFG